MLKHMLNGNASAATAPACGELSGATAPRHARSSSPDGGSRDPLSTTHRQQRHHQPALQPQPQQAQPSTQQQSPQLPSPLPQRQLRQPSDSVDNHLSSRLRHTVVSEPEYQNTRHRSSPTSEFCRSVPPAKSVRSLENVVVGVGEPESRMRRPALDAAWMVASARGRPSVPSHDSSGSIGASFAFMTAQQQLATPAHLLNHRDGTSNLSAIGAVSPAFAPIANGPIKPLANGGLHIAKRSPIGSATSTNVAARHATAASDSSADIGNDENEEAGAYGDCGREATFGDGVKEILTSLGLLCLISLLLALLSLIFLLKISPVTAADLKDLMRAEQFTIISPDEYVTVYEVTLALCSLTLSLNLCCLLVCSVQFLFAVKLARSSLNGDRTNNYLQKSAVTRVCAIAGFFISIPVFLTGVILYTFVQFHSTAAIITSVLVGSGIVFCGCAMVHNVFVWQKEKTNAVKEMVRQQHTLKQRPPRRRRREETSNKPDAVRGVDETSAVSACSPSFTLALGQGAAIDGGSVSRTSHELSTLV